MGITNSLCNELAQIMSSIISLAETLVYEEHCCYTVLHISIDSIKNKIILVITAILFVYI